MNGIFTIAYRDFTKFWRDRPRFAATFVFPILFIGVLGTGLQTSIGKDIGFNYLVFIFTGVLAQALFQSSALGVISLVEDRENDFSQEIFVAPVSRHAIIFGKILGESLVSLTQGAGIIIFGLIIGIPITLHQFTLMVPAAVMASFLGGAFGVIVLSNIKTQRGVNQLFPFIMFPQLFLAGVFNPIKELPFALFILSRMAPMTYAVDLMRGLYYRGQENISDIVLHAPLVNLVFIIGLFAVFLIFGTYLFVQNERNR
jgi:ABC-2 type transport system permease protein